MWQIHPLPMGGQVENSLQGFLVGVTEEHVSTPLTWTTDSPVCQWPLRVDKLSALEDQVEEQLSKGHIVPSDSPWNCPVFVIKKPGKDKWRLLHDLHKVNEVTEDVGSLQPGLPSPSMLPCD